MIIKLLYLFFPFLIFNSFGYSSAKVDTLSTIKESIKHADTYYWFGMAESGNVELFEKGLVYLNTASGLINECHTLSVADREELLRKVGALKTDINGQIALSFDTFYGFFPLTRLFTNSVFSDPVATGTYELVDDPLVMAATSAMASMSEEITGKWGREPQLDVVFTSVPNNSELENEALYIFNQSSKYFVHNKMEIVSVFNEEELEKFEQAIMTKEMKDKLIDSFNSTTLVMAVVRQLDIVEGDHFFLAEAYAYNRASDSAIRNLHVMGFSRDRTSSFNKFLVLNILLLCFAVAFYSFFHSSDFGGTKGRKYKLDINLSSSVAAAFYFFTGKMLPLLILPILEYLKPMPETLAIVSFWWCLFIGICIFIGPPILLKIVSVRLGTISEFFMSRGKGVASALAITLGIVCYFSELLVMKPIDSLYGFIFFLSISALASAFILGLSLDEREDAVSPKYFFITFLSFAGIGFAICTGEFLFMIYSAFFTIAMFLIVLYLNKLLPWQREVEIETDTVEEIDSELTGLTALIARHDYVPPEIYGVVKDFYEKFLNNEENSSIAIKLSGPSGVGKSAMANNIIEDTKNKNGDRFQIKENPDEPGGLVVLRGQCQTPIDTENTEEKDSDLDPYYIFKQALAGHFKINLLGSDNAKYQQIESAISSVYNAVMPIAGVFLPPLSPEENLASSDREIKIALLNMINNLLDDQDKNIIFLIDDIQWIDQSSKDLLKFIMEEFLDEKYQSKKNKIAFILTERLKHNDDPGWEFPSIDSSYNEVFKLEKPDKQHCKKILTESLKIDEESADRILKRTGDLNASDARGQLFWLFQTIIHIAQKDLFEQNASGKFKIKNWVGEIPVPNDMKENIRLQFEDHPEYKPVLECAACLGMEFNATLLSDSLGMDRIDLLRMLKNIDTSTGMINDDQEVDDLFRFQSSLVFEVIREQMAISGKGPQASGVPQIVREYHSMVATSLEKDAGSQNSLVFEIANHYYASGAKYADKAYKFCYKAAEASLAMYNFDKAKKYLKKAEECANYADVDMEEIGEFELIIDCHEAHITGENETEVAKKGLDHIKGLGDQPLKEKIELIIKVAEACYNVGQEEWFHATKELADMIIENAEDDSLEMAEGLHFQGLGMFPGRNFVDQRFDVFNRAYEIVNNFPESTRRNRLRGKIMTTLGNQKIDNGEKREGCELLFSRFDFDLEKNINDLKGKAITLGSLGRHYQYMRYSTHDDAKIADDNKYYIELALKYLDKYFLKLQRSDNDIKKQVDEVLNSGSQNIQKQYNQLAIQFYKEDLEVCKQINDFEGSSMMYSSLGGCSISESEYQVSLNYYKDSYEIASAKMDDSGLDYKFFAIIGILNSFSLMSKKDQDKSEIDLWGNRLNDLIDDQPKFRKNELTGEEVELSPMKIRRFPGMKDGDLGFIPLTDIVENWAKVFAGDWLDQLKGHMEK